MEIAETTIFTREITRILPDEEYQELQAFLVEHPKSGVVIKGSGGLRKIRWAIKNSGKSGGIRNIYYYHKENLSFQTIEDLYKLKIYLFVSVEY